MENGSLEGSSCEMFRERVDIPLDFSARYFG